ncbi:hypothetical protein GJ654_13840 [Rhodoblastus acidophilus]|jgi:hypothetical protein|uniref:Uncharacterized protein n=1 Tax=Rhodoblastus acidophilus TaxID=1074 RepID=A0A6N8DP20_RHOAC|nr:hypothetical protein [Rhodoblastus acidophilus]MCW2275569.1 hypothetical protein [Rhodoblastus acidophilus]MTV32068.1 hypothetical protein [Rhodoblastus acidophilus]
MQDHQGHDLLDSPATSKVEPPEAGETAPSPRPKPEPNLAHDFSNFAVAIVSAANLLQRFSHDPERVAEIAKLLRETGERAIDASRRLRS